MDSIALTYSLVGPFLALLRPIAAFCTAITAGLTENLLSNYRYPKEVARSSCKQYPCCDEGNSLSSGEFSRSGPRPAPGLASGMRFAFNDLVSDLAVWFILGTLLAGVITTVVPDSFFGNLIDPGIFSYGAMLVVSLPMYVCATMSTPIAAALIAKGISHGTALVFLLAGPATNVATVTLVGRILGRRSLLIYLTSVAACTLFFAYITDAFAPGVRPLIGGSFLDKPVGLLPAWVELGASILLGLLIMRVIALNGMVGLLRKAFSPVRVTSTADNNLRSEK